MADRNAAHPMGLEVKPARPVSPPPEFAPVPVGAPLDGEGWPRADRPITVAMLGWAWLSLQAREGSGYNLAASELAAGLAMSGHRVHYARAGMDFDLRRRPRVQRVERWRGVECYRILNSGNLSPASSNFRNMDREQADPRTASVVVAWLREIGAQVVHIHSLEGFGLDLIGAVRDAGMPVVVTPHNYWFLCPQVDLLHEEKRVCFDYDGGRRCVGCLEAPRPGTAIEKRRLEQSAYRLLGPAVGHTLRGMFFTAKSLASRLRPGGRDAELEKYDDVAHSPDAIKPDPEAWRGFETSESDSGLIDFGLRLRDKERAPELGRSPIDANERMLSADHHLKVLDNSVYGRRRLAGIEALNRASLVTPPSVFMLRVHERMGLRAELGRHLRLGLPHFDQIHRRARRSPYYRSRPWSPETASRPLRLGFFGTTRNNKGLAVFAEAIELLERDVRQRCQFVIRAGGHDWPFRKRLSRYPEVSYAGWYDQTMLVAAGGDYDIGVLSHVWLENSPLVLLEHLHAGKFVLSSRLGGPPEWITEPGESPEHPLGNGLCIAGGDAGGLASAIERVVSGAVRLPSAAEVHAASPLVSYPEHVREAEGLYLGLVCGEGGNLGEGAGGGKAVGVRGSVVSAAGGETRSTVIA